MKTAGLLPPEDSLYASQHLGLLHHVHAALRARFVYRRDVDYIVQQGQVIIVDEHTGRTISAIVQLLQEEEAARRSRRALRSRRRWPQRIPTSLLPTAP